VFLLRARIVLVALVVVARTTTGGFRESGDHFFVAYPFLFLSRSDYFVLVFVLFCGGATNS